MRGECLPGRGKRCVNPAGGFGMDELWACLALRHTKGLGARTWKRLLVEWGSAAEAVLHCKTWSTHNLERNGEADYIICLSHSGYYKEQGNDSEDIKLARKVPDIDVIISGHSHEKLDKPIKEGKTIIAGCGAYTEFLGHLVLDISKQGLSLDSYKLHKMDKDIKEDSGTTSEINFFKKRIDSRYFSKFGYSMDQTLARSSFDFESMESFIGNHGDSNLGDIIADSYRYGVKKAEGEDYEEIACTVVPGGVVRNSFHIAHQQHENYYNHCNTA